MDDRELLMLALANAYSTLGHLRVAMHRLTREDLGITASFYRDTLTQVNNAESAVECMTDLLSGKISEDD